MTRDEVLALVMQFVADTVEDLNVASIDPARPIREYGLSSLDVGEVISRSMRELKVKPARSELRRLSTINGLVDLLLRSEPAR